MDKFDRIYAVHQSLQSSRYPVSRKKLEDLLECTRSTVERTISNMRNYLNAPIEYDREANGYYYDIKNHENYELPGLWFNADELYALTVMQELLSKLQAGLLDEQIKPLKDRIHKLLADKQTGTDQINARLIFLHQTARKNNLPAFQKIASAVIQRKQLNIEYHARGNDETTTRLISPQRMIYYRDNWYLDAYCHTRGALRSFSLDRIKQTQVQDISATDINHKILDQHYSHAYGIFSGESIATATIKFTPQRARWVAEENWHPKQHGEWLNDGHYLLHIPYSDPTELIMDILKYGADAEILSPQYLRAQVAEKVKNLQEIYEKDVTPLRNGGVGVVE